MTMEQRSLVFEVLLIVCCGEAECGLMNSMLNRLCVEILNAEKVDFQRYRAVLLWQITVTSAAS